MKLFLQLLMSGFFIFGAFALINDYFIASAIYIGIGFLLDSLKSGLEDIANELNQTVNFNN